MKTKLFFSILSILVSMLSFAQTTEAFEDETQNGTSFTDNGQVFNITSQAGGLFDIYSSTNAYGWNGTANDFKFIDNSGSGPINMPVGFTISSAGATSFRVHSLWIYLSKTDLSSLGSGGGITFVGKLGGATQFTASATSGFNTSAGTNNGFTLINFASFGGADNTSKNIDQLVITTSGTFGYAALDAFKWQAAPTLSTDNGNKISKNSAYPNPTAGIFYLESDQQTEAQIYNYVGLLVKKVNIIKGKNTIDISNLPSGNYLVKTKEKTFNIIKN